MSKSFPRAGLSERRSTESASVVSECAVYLGGTFDPVHNGHLRLIIQALEGVGASKGVFIPCHITPHKSQPATPPLHRLGMLRALLDSEAVRSDTARAGLKLQINDFELIHDRPSYTIHTLQHLREKYGTSYSLIWVLGMDSLATLDSWRDWRSLTQWSNLAVLARPGWQMPERGVVADWWRERNVPPEQLSHMPFGGCAVLRGVESDVASSTLRERLKHYQSVAGFVPESVLHYIHQHEIYTNLIP